MSRRRVLLIAYACGPGTGSEPEVGYRTMLELGRTHEVVVLTRENNVPPLKRALSEAGVSGIGIIGFDLPAWARWWKRGQRGVQLYYYLWQLFAVSTVRRIVDEQRIDVVHHATFVKHWAPSAGAWGGVPFVWGPVGGADHTPWKMIPGFGLNGALYELARCAAIWLGEIDPLARYTARRSSVAVGSTPRTAQRIHAMGARHAIVHTQCATGELPLIGDRMQSGPGLRLLTGGRLNAWKGHHLAMEALALVDGIDWRWEIVGGGPELERLKKRAHRLGVEHRIEFTPTLPRDEYLRRLSSVDVMIHPSLHESGGFVVIEAMAAGVPVVAFDLGGPSVLLADGGGILLSARDDRRAIASIADAVRTLADPETRQRMGAVGRAVVERRLTWRDYGTWLSGLIDRAIEEGHAP